MGEASGVMRATEPIALGSSAETAGRTRKPSRVRQLALVLHPKVLAAEAQPRAKPFLLQKMRSEQMQ